MRYLGNKAKLLDFIEHTLIKYNIEGTSFGDLFAGSGSVGDYFKNKYQIISNDYLYFSSVINKAKLMNSTIPNFSNFIQKYEQSPFKWLNAKQYTPLENYFVYHNYSPVGDRMYLTEENAVKIDGIRIDIEEFYRTKLIKENEYYFLLGSLLESVTKVSNTSGTYQAFFKFWESRSLKDFTIEPLEMNDALAVDSNNIIYNENTNDLIRKISGDIAYIDPPYTTTQYTNSYHVLETIARYDNPDIFGITGRRINREFSGYSNKQQALFEFEDLFRQLDFEHILVSYSSQSIIPIDELVKLAKLFALNNEVHIEKNDYREYSTNNSSYKGDGKNLKEYLIYFKKNRNINKSPLNYSGSKDVLLPKIFKELPKHVGTFVDAMGGAFNVGANVYATQKVVYNENNKNVFEIVRMLLESDNDELICNIKKTIKRFDLKKKEKEPYIHFRSHYNELEKTPLNLFILQMYAFQNVMRFNSNNKYNTPIGNNEFSDGVIDRINNFKVKSPNFVLLNDDFMNIKINDFPEDTLFYFDPPYFITTAEYNDGKRGMNSWNADQEAELLMLLNKIDKAGYKFMLSNVIKHRDRTNHLLIEAIKTHGYTVIDIGATGIKYPRNEVLIKNF